MKNEEEGFMAGEGYEYNFMLERVYKSLKVDHMELIQSTKTVIHPPKIMKISGRRTAWINFQVYIYIYI